MVSLLTILASVSKKAYAYLEKSETAAHSSITAKSDTQPVMNGTLFIKSRNFLLLRKFFDFLNANFIFMTSHFFRRFL